MLQLNESSEPELIIPSLTEKASILSVPTDEEIEIALQSYHLLMS